MISGKMNNYSYMLRRISYEKKKSSNSSSKSFSWANKYNSWNNNKFKWMKKRKKKKCNSRRRKKNQSKNITKNRHSHTRWSFSTHRDKSRISPLCCTYHHSKTRSSRFVPYKKKEYNRQTKTRNSKSRRCMIHSLRMMIDFYVLTQIFLRNTMRRMMMMARIL